MTRKRSRTAAPQRVPSTFAPVRARQRHDGWTAERQVAFIEALAESGCVEESCRRVGMGVSSAYALRHRPDASSFRQAWDHALDMAIDRLADAAFSRAINGVSRPVFFQGEQVGERRYYDERLTMFLLRYRKQERYGAWLDDREARRHPEGAALTFARSLIRVDRDAVEMENGRPVRPKPPLVTVRHVSDEERAEKEEAAARSRADAVDRADRERQEREYQADLAALEAKGW